MRNLLKWKSNNLKYFLTEEFVFQNISSGSKTNFSGEPTVITQEIVEGI